MYVGEDAQFTVHNASFLGNRAFLDGAALYINEFVSSDIVIRNCSWKDNVAAQDGASIYLQRSPSDDSTWNITLEALQFIDCSARAGPNANIFWEFK